MYFFHCEETRRLVSIFKYIDAMLLSLDPDIVRTEPRLHSTCIKQFSSFIVFLKTNNDVLIFYFQ